MHDHLLLNALLAILSLGKTLCVWVEQPQISGPFICPIVGKEGNKNLGLIR